MVLVVIQHIGQNCFLLVGRTFLGTAAAPAAAFVGMGPFLAVGMGVLSFMPLLMGMFVGMCIFMGVFMAMAVCMSVFTVYNYIKEVRSSNKAV